MYSVVTKRLIHYKEEEEDEAVLIEMLGMAEMVEEEDAVPR